MSSFLACLITVSHVSLSQDLNSLYSAGDAVKAVVLKVDKEKKRISLGMPTPHVHMCCADVSLGLSASYFQDDDAADAVDEEEDQEDAVSQDEDEDVDTTSLARKVCLLSCTLSPCCKADAAQQQVEAEDEFPTYAEDSDDEQAEELVQSTAAAASDSESDEDEGDEGDEDVTVAPIQDATDKIKSKCVSFSVR